MPRAVQSWVRRHKCRCVGLLLKPTMLGRYPQSKRSFDPSPSPAVSSCWHCWLADGLRVQSPRGSVRDAASIFLKWPPVRRLQRVSAPNGRRADRSGAGPEDKPRGTHARPASSRGGGPFGTVSQASRLAVSRRCGPSRIAGRAIAADRTGLTNIALRPSAGRPCRAGPVGSGGLDAPRVSFHSFRKNAAQALKDKHATSAQIAELVGHEQGFNFSVYAPHQLCRRSRNWLIGLAITGWCSTICTSTNDARPRARHCRTRLWRVALEMGASFLSTRPSWSPFWLERLHVSIRCRTARSRHAPPVSPWSSEIPTMRPHDGLTSNLAAGGGSGRRRPGWRHHRGHHVGWRFSDWLADRWVAVARNQRRRLRAEASMRVAAWCADCHRPHRLAGWMAVGPTA